jgi:2-keto-4-pentenoate hydratase
VQGWTTLAEDLAALRITLHRDGQAVDTGVGTNVLDGPLNALRLWVDAMAEHTPQWQVRAGDFVTTGTITDAWPVRVGEVWRTAVFDASGAPARVVGLGVRVEA